MKVKLIAGNNLGSNRKGRTVKIAEGIVEDRWPLGGWVGQPDKKLEQEQGMGATQESQVLSDQR